MCPGQGDIGTNSPGQLTAQPETAPMSCSLSSRQRPNPWVAHPPQFSSDLIPGPSSLSCCPSPSVQEGRTVGAEELAFGALYTL